MFYMILYSDIHMYGWVCHFALNKFLNVIGVVQFVPFIYYGSGKVALELQKNKYNMALELQNNI